MITRIYKNVWFNILSSLIIAVILNGCYSQYSIRNYDFSDVDASSILKVYLKDGRTVDFTDKHGSNTFMSIDENGVEYKNHDGAIYKIVKQEIERIYNEKFSLFSTILLTIVSLLAGVLLFFVVVMTGFHGVG